MRPTWSHDQEGGDAWLEGLKESDNPYPSDTLAYFGWLSGNLSEELASCDDPQELDGRSMYLDEVMRSRRSLAHRLCADLPNVEEIARVIGSPIEEWPANCYGISQAILESGILDDHQRAHGRLFLNYGKYTGTVGQGSIFAGKPRIQHGWIESPNGHVVDPTRFVLLNASPDMWAGPINDYDMSGARARKSMQPLPYAITTPCPIRLPLNDPSSLAAFDRLLGLRSNEIKTSGFIDRVHLTWIANLPIQDMGEHAGLILNTLRLVGLSSLMPTDTARWIDNVGEWRALAERGELERSIKLRPD